MGDKVDDMITDVPVFLEFIELVSTTPPFTHFSLEWVIVDIGKMVIDVKLVTPNRIQSLHRFEIVALGDFYHFIKIWNGFLLCNIEQTVIGWAYSILETGSFKNAGYSHCMVAKT